MVPRWLSGGELVHQSSLVEALEGRIEKYERVNWGDKHPFDWDGRHAQRCRASAHRQEAM